MRALVVSNMLPDAANPGRGSFVRDQVAALRQLDGLDVELFEFPPGPRELLRAARELRRRHGATSTLSRRAASRGFDLVHAHFGLTAWPALAVPTRVRALTVHGTDLSQPRTRLATAAALPSVDLLAAVSRSLVDALPGAPARKRALVLPCGVDTARFAAIPQEHARRQLGRDPDAPCLLFPADPSRPEKRHDLALALAERCGVELLCLGGVDPAKVSLWINAANVVVVPSDREGYGLAVLEALACDVPVLATPVGVHAEALDGVAGTLCAPFELGAWTAAAEPHLAASEPRVAGRASADHHSASLMAERVRAAWHSALARSGQRSG